MLVYDMVVKVVYGLLVSYCRTVGSGVAGTAMAVLGSHAGIMKTLVLQNGTGCMDC